MEKRTAVFDRLTKSLTSIGVEEREHTDDSETQKILINGCASADPLRLGQLEGYFIDDH